MFNANELTEIKSLKRANESYADFLQRIESACEVLKKQDEVKQKRDEIFRLVEKLKELSPDYFFQDYIQDQDAHKTIMKLEFYL